MLPVGRGFWIWNLPKCEGGDVDKIIAKCKECHITWLSIKAGDQGRPWKQFSKTLVDKLHAAGIMVFGWSYDTPSAYRDQALVVKKVADAGADGFLFDAEIEWDKCPDPDAFAIKYLDEVVTKVPASFLLGDAPWDRPNVHQNFPFTEFGKVVDFRAPQAYWVAHKVSVETSCSKYWDSWKNYESLLLGKRKLPQAVKPHYPSGSTWSDPDYVCTVKDVLYFENFMKDKGCKGVLHWVWDMCPQAIWDAFKSGAIPPFVPKS